MSVPRRLVVGITGATGAVYGVRLLEALHGTGVETHLVMSRWGARTLLHELPLKLEEVRRLATHSYAEDDQGAAPSSGSMITEGMVIAPCSMRTLSAIAQGSAQNLVQRAADVTLKERRRLVLLVREAPLSEIHLENMLKLARMGAVILPPVPAFYDRPQSIDDIVNHTVQRALDLFGIHLDVPERWRGFRAAESRKPASGRTTSRAAAAARRPRAPRRRNGR
jgi:4-hydroxy-3-polyprenylbenzoate decarboxylase